MLTIPEALIYHAEAFSYALTPFAFPILTSLRLVQQQVKQSCMQKASNAPALATHMKANIVVPIVAPMLTSVIAVSNSFRMMMNIAVAITLAAHTTIAFSAVRSITRKATQRLDTDSKTTNIMTNDRHVPARKSPNIHCEAICMMLSISLTSDGRVTVT